MTDLQPQVQPAVAGCTSRSHNLQRLCAYTRLWSLHVARDAIRAGFSAPTPRVVRSRPHIDGPEVVAEQTYETRGC